VRVAFVGRAQGTGGVWVCAAGCPRAAREARRSIEVWTGHRGR
jgi:hypothetical protein